MNLFLRHVVRGALVLGFLAAALPQAAHAYEMDPFSAYGKVIEKAGRPAWLNEGIRFAYQTQDMGGAVSTELLTIQAVGREKTAVVLRFFHANPMMPGALRPGPTAGAVGPPARVGMWWVHPAVVQLAARLESKVWTKTQTDYELADGSKVKATSFEAKAGDKTYIYVYRNDSGMLLQYDQVSGDKRSTRKLVNVRQLQLPWLGGRPPAWIFRTRQLTYSGTNTLFRPGFAPTPLNMTIPVQVVGRGANFLAMNSPTADGKQTLLVAGPSACLGFWKPPLGLRNLQQGQTVDQDPTIRAKTFVQYRGMASYGREIVTLCEQGPGFSVWADYEVATGALLNTTFEVANSYRLQLRLTGRN